LETHQLPQRLKFVSFKQKRGGKFEIKIQHKTKEIKVMVSISLPDYPFVPPVFNIPSDKKINFDIPSHLKHLVDPIALEKRSSTLSFDDHIAQIENQINVVIPLSNFGSNRLLTLQVNHLFQCLNILYEIEDENKTETTIRDELGALVTTKYCNQTHTGRRRLLPLNFDTRSGLFK
jgi:hypothetical protein